MSKVIAWEIQCMVTIPCKTQKKYISEERIMSLRHLRDSQEDISIHI